MSKKRIQIDGRTAFVSGAASGIGRAVAQRLSAHGCPVAIVDQDEDGLSATAQLLEGRSLSAGSTSATVRPNWRSPPKSPSGPRHHWGWCSTTRG